MIHAIVNSDIAGNMIMALLDGTRTQEQVVEAMVVNVKNGLLTVRQGETPVTDEAAIKTHMTAIVSQLLEKLAQQNLLAA
jgi:methyltransferase-like protein